LIYGITLILLSLLAVPALLLAKKPDAKEILEKIAPYQGWIGLIFCFWGIWGIISAVLNISILTSWPIWWVTWLASSVIQAVLGFLLGYNLINKFVLSKSEQGRIKGAALLATLTPIQSTLGMIGICVGIWTIVASLLFFG